ncbi:YhdP family protein [Paucibacter sp. Y2R2-4]|uniref:YhdP family protein n=1 Tax=Paucibacter sp. Y2R2-4 TaxID=2893553 RepID=UPI0021E4B1B1|nr:YhdP family protein [Paucibacter sp. Y2R2-4]MCV2351284.1 TIGR02099 family protein [Paucibacter sp. Y2R2-4]
MSVLASVSTAGLIWLKRPARICWRVARWALALLLLAWSLVLLAWLVLHWAILPHIDEWRGSLERKASQTLGIELRIGKITVTSGGWIPALEMRDVRLLDPQGREALRLPRVAAALSARSLLSMHLRFEQLLIDAPQMEIRRDLRGKFYVAGFSVDDSPHAETADLAEEWADWLLQQHEFVILNGRVRWIDERRGSAPLDLSELNLVLRNGLRRHELRLDASPPPEWGQRFGLRGRFTQTLLSRPSELHTWSGLLYADLPRTDLRELRRHIDLPFELSEGDGALRAWIDVKNGGLQMVTVDMGLGTVKMRLAPNAEPLALARIEGRLQMLMEAQQWSLRARQLGFVSGDGVVWPRSDWQIALKLPKASALPADGGASAVDQTKTLLPLGGEVSAERLDLALMAQLAQRLPLGERARAWLSEMAPRGVLSQLNARWDGPLDEPRSYKVKGDLQGLQLGETAEPEEAGVVLLADAKPARPALRGLDLQVDANERGGQASLKMKDGLLSLPGVFRRPLPPMQSLSAKLNWRIESKAQQLPKVEVRINDLRVQNQDVRGEFDGVWRSAAAAGQTRIFETPGWLELNGKFERIDAVKVQHYLPLAVGDHTLDYLRDALRAGEARAVTLKLRGELAKFPFQGQRDGQFRVVTQVRDVDMAYVPAAEGQPLNWPLLERINGELIFERGGMQIRNARAKVFGYELSGIKGGIKDLLLAHQLEIEGVGSGPAADLLKFVRQSPVNEASGHILAAATASAAANLKLSLNLPLNELSKSVVKGSVQMQGGDLRLRPDLPLMSNARGVIEFDRRGVKLQGLQVRALGGEASIEGGSLADGSLRFVAQGVASAEALRRMPELGLASKLAQAATGQTAYRLQLGLLNGQAETSLTSNLVGLGLDLPAPLKKDAAVALPLRVQILPQGGRDELRVELGNTLQAHYLRDISAEPARVIKGALSIQDNLPGLPDSGVQLQANLDQVNLDAWQSSLQRLLGSSSLDIAAQEPGAQSAEAGYVPSQIALRANGLQVMGRPLTRVVAGISHVGNAWRCTIDAEQMGGFFEVRSAKAGQGSRIYARLSRLSLPKQEAEAVRRVLDHQAGQVPDLDIIVDDFELRGKRMGRLEVEAQASGVARDWRLSKLQLKSNDAVLNATGQWLNEPGRAQRRTVLDWKLDLLDAGDTLERLGQGRVLRGGRGQLKGELAWIGEPLSPDFPSMNGQLSVALESGQFLNVEPGVGRLLGVLSLQSLPRRFLFDFRDVFSEGFTFDGISGDVKIARGVASSSNLRTRGVQAAVLLDGSADLAAETQNLRVLVVPEINTGGASLAYAAINPAIGLGTFLAQWILSRPLAAANTREFHITGSWVDPRVEQVEHRVDEPGKAASAP